MVKHWGDTWCMRDERVIRLDIGFLEGSLKNVMVISPTCDTPIAHFGNVRLMQWEKRFTSSPEYF